MGNCLTHDQTQSPNVTAVSDLYTACGNGDTQRVEQILKRIVHDEQLNRVEPNGSTTLHAAAYFGHKEIVELLLQQKYISTTIINRYGNIAEEESADDDIRTLFQDRKNADNTTITNDKERFQFYEIIRLIQQ
ncbi:unnamed protein product [Didymodactylos carnosus]|uniref:Ankyrin repeat protein n=1 Tax=Didymodactylos carnosus TaxID=1234261 RepID=A0A815FM46_9BILA|nr:unnamed protein product [Didymodactylos carnosus]CAF1327326.1 unnamed protein product [Didymodactylos carnosus]CAF4127548.1 unnamed protein product [Didymodactylos carnosus]CAF4177958.1 unnamed protein product [Didymodactylos carnosus]